MCNLKTGRSCFDAYCGGTCTLTACCPDDLSKIFVNADGLKLEEAREVARQEGCTSFTLGPNDPNMEEDNNPVFCVFHGQYQGFYYQDISEAHSSDIWDEMCEEIEAEDLSYGYS